jgi:hypothetical protein
MTKMRKRIVSIIPMGNVSNMQHSISQGPKGHIYIVHVQVCKYAGNPLTGGETTIYIYTSNTPPLKLMVDPQHRVWRERNYVVL